MEFFVFFSFYLFQTSFTFIIPHNTTPYQLIVLILNKRANSLMTRGERPNDFTLKVCGQEEYLIGDFPLIQFSYIQDCLARDIPLTLVTMSIENVVVDHDSLFENPELDTLKRARPTFSTLTLRKKGKHISAWKIEDWFAFTVNGISRLNCDAANRTVEVCYNNNKLFYMLIILIYFVNINFFLLMIGRLDYKPVFFMVVNLCAKAKKPKRLSLILMGVATGKKHLDLISELKIYQEMLDFVLYFMK